jgi:type II secretion system protein N
MMGANLRKLGMRGPRKQMALEVKNKKWLGYTVYVVLVALFLLYLLFPVSAVEEFVAHSVTRINPDLAFKAAKIKPWIPAGLRIVEGRIYLRDAPGQPVFEADKLYIAPQLLKLIRGDYFFTLEGEAYGGEIAGSIHAAGKGSAAFGTEVSFSDFNLGDYDLLAQKFTHRISGSLSGGIVYGSSPAGNAGGSGRADLHLSGGQLQFQAPVFGISSIDLQSIDLGMELSGRKVTIVRAELAGQEVKASMTGTIQLQENVELSQVNLKGTLEFLAEFYKNHPDILELLRSMKKRVRRGQYFFAITGTLGTPRFMLL